MPDPKKFVRILYPEMWWQEASRVRGDDKYSYKDIFRVGNICGFQAKEFGTDLLVVAVVDVTNLDEREGEGTLADIEFFLNGDPTCTMVHIHYHTATDQSTMQINWKWEIADVEKPEGG